MITRFSSVMAIVTLLTLTSGCSGVKNFLFGRGARCGLCNRIGSVIPTPQFGNNMQAPAGCGQNVCPPGPAPGYGPDYQAAGPGCQCGADPSMGHPAGCTCGTTSSGYGPMEHDPYLSNGSIDTIPYSGQPLEGQVYPGGSIQPDDFRARRYDSDGNQILWEEPLPPGVSSM